MTVKDGRVILYIADIRPLYRKDLQEKVYRMLDPKRQEKADLCKDEKGKAACLAAGFLASYALQNNGCGQGRVWYEKGGRPVVEMPKGKPPVFISLSHSGIYAVCALAHRPVGVDIQQIRPVRAGMLRHFLNPEEREAFRQTYQDRIGEFLEKEAQTVFLRQWTAKESYMKLTGTGMSAGFNNLCADLFSGHVWKKGEENEAAVLKEYPAPEGYFLSACISPERRDYTDGN